MTTLRISLALAAAFAAFAGSTVLASSDANAGSRGRQLYLETYTFSKPMHGYSGHAGNQYCDYQRLPQRKCDASGQNCKIVAWTLQEICQ